MHDPNRMRLTWPVGTALRRAAPAAALVVGGLCGVSPLEAQAPSPVASGSPTERRIAVTFDDVPATGSDRATCDAAALEDLTRRLVEGISALGMPATGLVVESRVCEELRPDLLPRLLTAWLDAGLDLGNHTFSHPDLNRTPVDSYEADIVSGEATVEPLLRQRGRRLRYFRYPLLHTGTTIATKRAVEGFLDERGYSIAPVTIDNQEWVFAAIYSRAKARGDSATQIRIARSYLEHMAEALEFYEQLSIDLLGYELPQVLLLHANEMNADLLGELGALLRARGYRFIALDEALMDPAYDRPDEYVGPRGLSWLQRWALADGLDVPPEPREPGWVADLFRTY